MSNHYHKYTQEEVEFLAAVVLGGASQKETAARFNEKFMTNISPHVLAMKCYSLGLGKGKRGKRRSVKEIGDEYEFNSRGDIYAKVAEPCVLRLKSHIVWERYHNSPVPSGHIIIFLDGNRTNCNVDNLAIVSRAVNARINQNGLRYTDPTLTTVGINIGKVLCEAGKARRRAGRE